MSEGASSIRILPGDFANARVIALLREHLAGMDAYSPPGSCHVLDLRGLQAANVDFFAAWDGEDLLGFGALRHVDASLGEIKSMRTAGAHLRRGVASRLLDHLLALARERGYRRVSLETGSGPAFEAAIALYLRYGFRFGAAFADYVATDFNRFMHLDLGREA
jgi:putative acetyltransferase